MAWSNCKAIDVEDLVGPGAAGGVRRGPRDALARSRLPARLAINVHTSLLLMLDLLATAGLGIFWKPA